MVWLYECKLPPPRAGRALADREPGACWSAAVSGRGRADAPMLALRVGTAAAAE